MNVSELLQTKNSLRMPLETWQRYLALPAVSRDQFIAGDHYADPHGQWDVSEILLAEAINEGKPSNDYHMSVLLHGEENRYVELDFGAGRFRRSSQPGNIVFGTGGSIKGRGLFHSVGFHISQAELYRRMGLILGREIHSLEKLQSNTFQDDLISALLLQLLRSFRTEIPQLRDDLVDRICHRLLILTSHKVTEVSPSDTMHARSIKEVIDYIHANLHRELTREELAKIAGVSGPYFSRLFGQTVGESPKRYLLKRRIERASRLLIDGDADTPLAVIASKCGFANQSQFCVAFRRFVGVSPGEYRRLQQ